MAFFTRAQALRAAGLGSKSSSETKEDRKSIQEMLAAENENMEAEIRRKYGFKPEDKVTIKVIPLPEGMSLKDLVNFDGDDGGTVLREDRSLFGCDRQRSHGGGSADKVTAPVTDSRTAQPETVADLYRQAAASFEALSYVFSRLSR